MSLPRMSWHIGDYKKDTGHLRAAGHGAYFLLCMHYWATDGLPDDDKQLAAIACMTDREWKAIRPTMQALFKDGLWRHKRIDKELAEATLKYERRVEAGRRGGKAKAEAEQCFSNARANAQAKLKQPITDKEKKDGADAPPIDPDADLFRRGEEVLGKGAGSLIARLKKAKNGSIPHTRSVIEQASTKHNPREYVGAVLRGAAEQQADFYSPTAGII